jgi:hypothetical protein
MRLTLLAKDLESGKAGCKSVYLAENGKLVIQGDLLDEATKANLLNLLAGEGAVEIDVDIVRAALVRLT